MFERIDIYIKKQVGKRTLFVYECSTRMSKTLKAAKEEYCRVENVLPENVKCIFSERV